jgi:Immunoglobulin domain
MSRPTTQHSLSVRLKKLALPIAVVAITVGATNALAGPPTLTDIPTLSGDASNEGRAITSDGQYVVGLSGTATGFLYPVGSASSIYVLSSDNAGATVANGVGYRTSGSSKELIISGMSSGFETEWMTADGGTSFGGKRRNAGWTYAQDMGAVNQLGSSISSDAYYVSSRSTAQTSLLIVGGASGAWVPTMVYYQKGTSADKGGMNGVSASGRAVGWRGASSGSITRGNYMLTWTGGGGGSPAFFNGLVAGQTWGEAMSVSADGLTVFGRSPIITGGTDFYGYKVVNPGGSQTINALPEFPDTGGSTSRSVPYGCTADGKYAAGMNYRGGEKGVIWDTSDADPNKWTVLDLTDLASANGFLGIFTLNLRRAYSVGTNAAGDLVATGYGVDASAIKRAFAMTVPRWIAAIGFPISQTVNFGANVTFSLKTNGTDSLTYQWYKNGAPLTGSTTTALSLTGVTCPGGEAGTYSVVVGNAPVSGVVTGAMTLTVNDPIISVQPVNQFNIHGTTATFTVTASGSSALSYQWKRGGGDLADGATGWGSTIAGATTATLTISDVRPGDAQNGDYTVVVSDSLSCAVTSAARTLTVQAARPVLSTYVDTTGGNYTLTFSGPNGQTYTVLYSTDITLPLTSWTWLTAGTFGASPATYQDVAPPDPQRFYVILSP